MATLYCYDFDGYTLKEETVEVIETEKQYMAVSGNIPFVHKSKLNKSELGLCGTFSYVSTLPAYEEALDALIQKDTDYVYVNEFNAARGKERLANLQKLKEGIGK